MRRSKRSVRPFCTIFPAGSLAIGHIGLLNVWGSEIVHSLDEMLFNRATTAWHGGTKLSQQQHSVLSILVVDYPSINISRHLVPISIIFRINNNDSTYDFPKRVLDLVTREARQSFIFLPAVIFFSICMKCLQSRLNIIWGLNRVV